MNQELLNKLNECLEYCLDQIETSNNEILENVSANDVKKLIGILNAK